MTALAQLRRARARRHLLRVVPSHGARQGGHRQVSRPAAERLHRGAAGGAQSGLHRLCHDLHRQLLRRPAERALRPVPGAEEEADEARDRQRPGAQPDHHRRPRCAAPATPCTCRSCIAARRSGTSTSRRPIRNGRSATTAPATRPTAPLPYGSGPQAQSCQGCHMPNKDADGNPYRSKIAAIQEYTQLPAGRAHARRRPTSTCRSAPASASTRWSASTSTCSRWRGSSPTSSASARPIRC